MHSLYKPRYVLSDDDDGADHLHQERHDIA